MRNSFGVLGMSLGIQACAYPALQLQPDYPTEVMGVFSLESTHDVMKQVAATCAERNQQVHICLEADDQLAIRMTQKLFPQAEGGNHFFPDGSSLTVKRTVSGNSAIEIMAPESVDQPYEILEIGSAGHLQKMYRSWSSEGGWNTVLISPYREKPYFEKKNDDKDCGTAIMSEGKRVIPYNPNLYKGPEEYLEDTVNKLDPEAMIDWEALRLLYSPAELSQNPMKPEEFLRKNQRPSSLNFALFVQEIFERNGKRAYIVNGEEYLPEASPLNGFVTIMLEQTKAGQIHVLHVGARSVGKNGLVYQNHYDREVEIHGHTGFSDIQGIFKATFIAANLKPGEAELLFPLWEKIGGSSVPIHAWDGHQLELKNIPWEDMVNKN